MTPERANAIKVLRELRDHLGIPQQPAASEEAATLNSLIYTLNPRRAQVPDELAHRAEKAIADIWAEQG